jgi:predicted DNA-binding transcriptional regulator YafY
MSKSDRLFELIQLLRRAKRPVTAERLAGELDVTARTVYRYIAALQAMRIPIAGEAGVGYVMRPGYDLPPLMFTAAESEAIHVGLALLSRTGDRSLIKAAKTVSAKIADVLPANARRDFERLPHRVSSYGVKPSGPVSLDMVRECMRTSRKLRITYRDAEYATTSRVILPVALFYYVKVVTIAAWCELRQDVRNFRVDRIVSGRMLDAYFTDRAQNLREAWEASQDGDVKLLK